MTEPNAENDRTCLACGEALRRTPGGLLTCDTDWCAGNIATRSRIPDPAPIAENDAPACECSWTDPSTWLSAASCGYGSGYEPGSQMEWNPDCPAHPPYVIPPGKE